MVGWRHANLPPSHKRGLWRWRVKGTFLDFPASQNALPRALRESSPLGVYTSSILVVPHIRRKRELVKDSIPSPFLCAGQRRREKVSSSQASAPWPLHAKPIRHGVKRSWKGLFAACLLWSERIKDKKIFVTKISASFMISVKQINQKSGYVPTLPIDLFDWDVEIAESFAQFLMRFSQR